MKPRVRTKKEKELWRNANYEYMTNKKYVSAKDNMAKIAFERKPYHLQKEEDDDRQ